MLPVTISHVADAAADVDDTDAAPLIDTLPSGGGAPPIIPCPLALGRFSQIDPGTSALVPQLSALHATLKLFKRRAGAANGDGDTAGDTSTDAEADDLLLPPGDGVRPSGKTMTGEGNVDEAPLPELPSLQALRGLRAELDTLATATAKRANMLQEELGKTDHFLRMRGIRTGSTASDGTTGSSLPSAMSANNTGQTIKLNLKKIRPVLPDDAASDKRKRSGSVDSAGGDSDTRASREIKSSFQKKKQRLLGQQQQQQRQHGLLDGLGGATTTVGGSLEPSLLLGDGASAGGTAMPKLAGEEPAKIKPANQVSINVFWNYVDGFFKNITEEDVRVLEQKESTDPAPFIIPPLGRHYKEAWAEEDRLLNPTIDYVARKTSKSQQQPSTSSSANGGVKSTVIDDASLVPEECLCGPLTERLVAALMEEEHAADDVQGSAGWSPESPSDDLGADDKSESPSVVYPARSLQQTKEEMYDMEERLKRELRFVGLLDDNEVGPLAEENDEISVELRALQNELRRIIELNNARRVVIRDLAEDQMAYQEYAMVVDEIDKQVDQAFQKRTKSSKKKKKISGGMYLKPAPDGVHALLDRRRRLLHEFKPIFPQSIRLAPHESVFGDEPMWAAGSNLLTIAERSMAHQAQAALVAASAPKLMAPPRGSLSNPPSALPGGAKELPSVKKEPAAQSASLPAMMDLDVAPAVAPVQPPPSSKERQVSASKTVPAVASLLAAPATDVDADTTAGDSAKKPKKKSSAKPRKSEGASVEGHQVAGKTRPTAPAITTDEATASGTATPVPDATASSTGGADDAPAKKPRKKYTRKKKSDEPVAAKTVPGGSGKGGSNGNSENKEGDGASDLLPDWLVKL